MTESLLYIRGAFCQKDENMIKNTYFTLKNGIKVPAIGIGTWQVAPGEEAYNTVKHALLAGYRHVDTAYTYGNEGSVGEAIRDSGIPRDEIFITSKLPADIKTYEGARESFLESLGNLGVDYMDLYLIHAPWPWSAVGTNCDEGNTAAWQAMIDLYNEGKVRAIGVSNFHPSDIENLIKTTGFSPMVNQIRYFIGNTQQHITDYCNERGILIEAYSPLATGALVEDSHLVSLSEKYGKSIPKICIRYCIEKGTLPLPKSTNPQRIADNLDVDFKMDEEDVAYLDSLYHIGPTRELRS
jgi:diketogulonate reductase-like aldo/keto reductase